MPILAAGPSADVAIRKMGRLAGIGAFQRGSSAIFAFGSARGGRRNMLRAGLAVPANMADECKGKKCRTL